MEKGSSVSKRHEVCKSGLTRMTRRSGKDGDSLDLQWSFACSKILISTSPTKLRMRSIQRIHKHPMA